MVHQRQPEIIIARHAADAACLGITVFAIKTARIMKGKMSLDADKSTTF